MKKVKVNVTQRDIDIGKEEISKGNYICKVCPVARACLRLKIFKEGLVDGYTIHRNTNLAGAHWSMDLPQVARTWISNFDRHTVVAPFKFTIEVPECLTK